MAEKIPHQLSNYQLRKEGSTPYSFAIAEFTFDVDSLTD
jgi:hypothetical protein